MSTTHGSLSAGVTADEVFALVRDALATVLELDPGSITSTTALAEVGADSLALVEVAEIVEERLAEQTGRRLRIPDAHLESFGTAGEAADYLAAGIRTAAWAG